MKLLAKKREEFMKKVKARIMRTARHRRGWTQFNLAQRVGCSESQIGKIETGRVVAALWLREAIARELGIASLEVGL